MTTEKRVSAEAAPKREGHYLSDVTQAAKNKRASHQAKKAEMDSRPNEAVKKGMRLSLPNVRATSIETPGTFGNTEKPSSSLTNGGG